MSDKPQDSQPAPKTTEGTPVHRTTVVDGKPTSTSTWSSRDDYAQQKPKGK